MSFEYPTTRRRRLASEINVVPYIDVMLVLLVIFMVTAPLLTPGIEVNLPETDAESMQVDSERDPIVLTVMSDGRYFLNIAPQGNEKPVSRDEIFSYLRPILARNPQETVLLEGDERTEYGNIARAMAILQSAGVSRIGFPTDSEDSN